MEMNLSPMVGISRLANVRTVKRWQVEIVKARLADRPYIVMLDWRGYYDRRVALEYRPQKTPQQRHPYMCSLRRAQTDYTKNCWPRPTLSGALQEAETEIRESLLTQEAWEYLRKGRAIGK